MKIFLFVLGVLLILGGIFVGLYLGIWVMFIGGIVALITDIKAANIIPLHIAIDIARIVCASAVGAFSWMICFTLGMGSIAIAAKP
jgi:hypothetical protein